jgi:hypothetical protein
MSQFHQLETDGAVSAGGELIEPLTAPASGRSAPGTLGPCALRIDSGPKALELEEQYCRLDQSW